MGSFRKILYSALLGITFGTMFSLVNYLVITMPNIIMNPITRLEIALAIAVPYTAIITLLLYLLGHSEHESQG